jgi:hypothetical protein
MMKESWLALVGSVLPSLVMAQSAQTAQAGPASTPAEKGPFARIALLRPHEGKTVEFEAGYIRHLEWHRQARDPFTWYGWSVWASDRQRWFVYATFGHAASDFDHAVAPAEDERDNVMNVVPHAEFAGNAFYEFLPALSRGTGEPRPAPRVEMTTVDLLPGKAKEFEATLGAEQSKLQGETLWYRMLAGGALPRYLRLRPMPNVASILDERAREPLSGTITVLVSKTSGEILNLRPTMSYNLPAAK